MGDSVKKRECGIDILRCIALFLVTVLHSFKYNGFYGVAQNGIFVLFADSVRWLSYSCVGLFLLITGYLKSTKSINRKWFWDLIPILVSYLLTCCISFPIRHFFLGDPLPLKDWIIKFLSFGNYAWYVEMYIGLMLICPIVNLALEQLKEPKQLLLAAGVAVFVTALPTVTVWPIIPDYWTAIWPITYYIIGAVIRRLQPRVGVFKGICTILTLMLGMGMISMLSTDSVFDDSFQYNNGIWVTCMATVIFITFYQIRPNDSIRKIAAWMAGGCFEGYLLSRLLDVVVYSWVPQWHDPQKYFLIWLFVTLPVFLVSVVMGKLTHTYTVWIMGFVNRVSNSIRLAFQKIIEQ